MKAVIISIGDELLIGQVVNTNASFIAQQLNRVGIQIHRVVAVGDDLTEILNTFQVEYASHDVIIITGGLGPTHDDITRTAVCKFFNTELVHDAEARANVERIMKTLNRPWTASAEDQTLIPRGAKVIPNKLGTAPGEFFERDGKYFFVMPGVPYEMEAMVKDFIVPFFEKKQSGTFIVHRTLRTTGIPESALAERLGNLDEILQGASLAFLPSVSGVRLRITATDSDRTACEKKILEVESRIRSKAEKFIYGINDEELEQVVGRLLTDKNLTLSVAESCTGGMIAHILTNVPGSSEYFDRGVVTYSNKSKTQILNVPAELIEQHGAVSSEVAKEMARGIRTISETSIGLSTTGIAGPSGGSPEKPVGLVWIGYADAQETIALKFQFGNDRIRIKERASFAAIELIRRKLLQIT